jgi:membrane-associated phospholipid phosphatase
VVASEYHDEPLVPLGAYGLATLVSWSRLNDDEHWASDVFFGSALGYGIGRLVYASDPFLRRHHLQLRPMAGNGATGLNVATRF